MSISRTRWSNEHLIVVSIAPQTPTNILVVDDDVDNALLLRDYLQLSGFDVDVYFSSEEASENFSGGHYSLAVLDVLMNGIDGFELYKRLSNIDSNIRVCFLTGCEINVSDFTDLPENKTKIIQKPIRLGKLLQIVRTLLNDNNKESQPS